MHYASYLISYNLTQLNHQEMFWFCLVYQYQVQKLRNPIIQCCLPMAYHFFLDEEVKQPYTVLNVTITHIYTLVS